MIKSFQRLGIIIGAITLLSSCQTYKVSLTYNPPSISQRIIKGEPLIKLDKINDVRNLKGAEIGSIKNEFGIPIKSIYAKQPVSEITKTAFSHAMISACKYEIVAISHGMKFEARYEIIPGMISW